MSMFRYPVEFWEMQSCLIVIVLKGPGDLSTMTMRSAAGWYWTMQIGSSAGAGVPLCPPFQTEMGRAGLSLWAGWSWHPKLHCRLGAKILNLLAWAL